MSTGTRDPTQPTIVLVHGLWMTPRSWEHWIDRYRSRGHEVLAPSWPGMEGEVEQVNRDPSPMKGVGIKRIADHYVGLATFTRNGPTTVDFTRDDRAPMLSIAFEHDHIVPPKAARHNVEKYKSNALTVFKEFPGRPHFPGAPGWEEVADYALAWATIPTPAGVDQKEPAAA
jgi:pimeloyl-ACP methyl ester carboxylesterase